MNKFIQYIRTDILKNKKIKYLLVGGSAFALEYLVFLILNHFTGWVVTANILSFLVGLSYSFALHLKWTFMGNHRHKLRSQLISYGLLAGINLCLTSIIIALLVDTAGLLPLIAKIICMVLVITWNFLILNRFIFKAKEA